MEKVTLETNLNEENAVFFFTLTVLWKNNSTGREEMTYDDLVEGANNGEFFTINQTFPFFSYFDWPRD